jgi:hypothetical protein
MKTNRHQTVTQTGSPKGTPRKLRAVKHLPVRRVGIEPTTYSLRTFARRTGFWFSPLRTARNLVRSLLERPKSRNSNRHATVTGFADQRRFPGDVWGWL